MRKLFAILFALLFMTGGSAAVVAAQATPAATPSAGSSATGTIDPKVGEPSTYYAKNGKKVATIEVTKVDRPWKGYGEYEEPDAGTEYVAFTVEVKNTSSSAVKVQSFDFILQDAQGHAFGTAYAQGKDSLKIAPLDNEVRISGGKSETFLLVFKVDQGDQLAHLFWRADSDSLVTVANLAGE